VEQYEWEGVLIPAAVAHQVRNVRSCIKTALDYVSPESVGECMKLREEIRRLAIIETEAEDAAAEADVGDRHYQDKLQVGNMVFEALLRALGELSEAAQPAPGASAPALTGPLSRMTLEAAYGRVVEYLRLVMPFAKDWTPGDDLRVRILDDLLAVGVSDELAARAVVLRVCKQVAAQLTAQVRAELPVGQGGGGGGGGGRG
jgi:lysine-specific demethylase 3